MQPNDEAKIRYYNGKPYVEYYLDKAKLTGITVICSPDTIDEARQDTEGIRKYIYDRGYKADVKVEVFEDNGNDETGGAAADQ